MSEKKEIQIIGTELQETNALVYTDTKLQTLDRRVGKDNLYFGKEMFEQSLSDWDGTPIIYQKDGLHPDDFEAVRLDPRKAAEDIGGKLVGRVHDPRIVVEGGARLMATLSIDEDEAEISRLWQSGRLFPSTAFTTYSDGDKITTPPVPNHVLLFPMQVDKVVPGDPGAFVNTQVSNSMNQTTIQESESEEKSPELMEAAGIITAKDEEIERLKAELDEVRKLLSDYDAVKAELEKYRLAEKESMFRRLIQNLPVGMTQTEDQRIQLRDMLENNPRDLVFAILETKVEEHKMTTQKSGIPYTFSENVTPLTTVGNLSGGKN